MINYDNALITGASSGIGREYALQIALKTKTMLLVGRNTSELKITEQQVLKLNPHLQTHIITCDLCDEAQREKLISSANEVGIDLFINASGGGNFGLFKDSSWEKEKQVISLNIEAPTHLARGLIHNIIQRSQKKRCAMIFVSSHASFMRIPHFSVYASCKSYLDHFVLTLVQELKNENIDIMTVLPGATQSKFSERSGLPKKMLSTPVHPRVVVGRTLRNLGKTSFLIVTPFDRLIYTAGRFLPLWFLDSFIAKTQLKLLRKAGVQTDSPSLNETPRGSA